MVKLKSEIETVEYSRLCPQRHTVPNKLCYCIAIGKYDFFSSKIIRDNIEMDISTTSVTREAITILQSAQLTTLKHPKSYALSF